VADHAEASAKSVEAAVAVAAAQLGLRADQVEFEVLDEPVPSTFGVIGSPARVRVTARATPAPAAVTATPDPSPAPELAPVAAGSREAGRPDAGGTVGRAEPSPARSGRPSGEHDSEPLDEDTIAADTELAADFVEGLLDVLDLDGDITTWVDATGGHVEVEGAALDMLVGVEGEVLGALQELTRLAVLRQTRHRPRVHVDVGGFKARRQQELAEMARSTARRVVESGQQEQLRPMTPFERKIVHDAVREVAGATTESVGEEPQRCVVVLPAG
jgi:spoIIIJ-associated protein